MKLKDCAVLALLMLGSTGAFSQYNQEFELTQIRSFGGSGLELTADMKLDSEGNQYLLGRYRDIFDDGNGVTDDALGVDRLFLQKSDINGSIVWTKLIIDPQNGFSLSPGELAIDSDDNVYVFFSGDRNQVVVDPNGDNIAPMSTQSGANQGPDFFLWKLKPNGGSAWVKNFGGNDHDWARTITVDANDDLILGGAFLNASNFQPDLGPDLPLIQDVSFVLTTPTQGGNDYDGFVAKLDSSGQAIWLSQFDGSGFEQVEDIAVDGLGIISVVGWTESSDFTFPNISSSTFSSSQKDGFVGRLSSLGIGFAVEYLAGSGADDQCIKVEVDSSNNTYVSTRFQSSTLNFGGQSVSNVGGVDALLVKFSPTLAYEWNYPIVSPGNDIIRDVTISENQQVYATGTVGGISNHGGVNYGFSATGNDAYVLNLANDGTFNHFSVTGGLGVEAAQNIEFHTDGSMFIYGEAEANVPFIVGTDTMYLNNAGSRDVFVVQGYDCFGLNAPEVTLVGDSLIGNLSVGTSFEWLFDDGTTVSTYSSSGENYLASPADSGAYALVISYGNCPSDTSNFVVYNPNSGGTSGIGEIAQGSVNVYPNPTSGILHVEFLHTHKPEKLVIQDLNGREVMVVDSQSVIDISELQTGVYLLKIASTKGEVQTIRILKK